tara:strand:- start:503 stop:1294 length:792 start_codon:yes stop_codon:yes gene_type:complete
MNDKLVPKVEAENLKDLKVIRHAFFTRAGGVSRGIYGSLNVGFGSRDQPEKIRENRRRAMKSIDRTESALHTVFQVHGKTVINVQDGGWDAAFAPPADAMVTNQPGHVLGVMTADCVPVLFADAEAGVIGAAHCGWKGTLVGILTATLEAMEGLGASRTNIRAAVGPAIAQDSYEVGPEFPAPFLQVDPENTQFFKPSVKDNHFMFDLTGCVSNILGKTPVGSVEHLNMDTCADSDRFFSYRRATHQREPDYGRGLSVISLDH